MTDAVHFPVFPITQPIGDFFVGVIESSQLLKICEFDYRRMEYKNGYMEFMGIQRKLDPRRLEKIAAFVRTIDACFPSSIVISVDQKCARIEKRAGIDHLCVTPYVDPEDSTLSISLDKSASIIDGQHRLKGLDQGKVDFQLSVTVFIGVDAAMEALLFSRVNLAQTKVNRSLAYDLFALAHERSPERTCHEITVALDEFDYSPFKGRIKRLGVATEGRFGETLSQATIVSGILPYISDDPDGDRDRGKRFGFWEPLSPKDHTRRIFYEFFRRDKDSMILEILINYFAAIAERWPIAWANSGTGMMIRRTNGFNGFCRFLRPAYLHFTTTQEVVTKAKFSSLFSQVTLKDEDFTVERFVPGTSGASQLFRELLSQTRLSG